MPMNLVHIIILGFIIYYSIATPINREDGLSFIRNGQHSKHADQIIGIKKRSMRFSPNTTTRKLRQKRNNVDTMDIKAIQTTINDHKTMIEDNRVMIYNVINSSINTNNIKEAVVNHYTNAPPIWSSWRDCALILVTIVTVIQIISFCTYHVQLKPCDFIISRILQRYENRPSVKPHSLFSTLATDNPVNVVHARKRQYPPICQQPSVKNIEDQYAEIQQTRTVSV